MKTLYRLADFEGKFVNEDCLLVASGPTTFDYQNLKNHSGPIAFINDTISISHYAGNRHNLFFSTIHADSYAEEMNQDGLILMLPKGHLPDYVHNDVLLYNWREQGHTTFPNAERNELYCASNSTLPPIHLFALAGCKELKVIGGELIENNGEVILHHDYRLKPNRLNGGPQDTNFNAIACHKAIIDTCELLGMTTIFITDL